MGLKILHLISSGGLYGAERMLLTLASECQEMGHKPVVGTILGLVDIGNELLEEASRRGLEAEVFRAGGRARFRDINAILDFAVKSRIQVIHAHGYKAIILLALASERVRPCPFVCTLHGWTAHRNLSKLAVYEWLARKLTVRFDRIVSVSSDMVASLPKSLPRNHIAVIPNGIALTQRVSRASRCSLPAKPPLILAVGRLSFEKGFDLLLEASAELRTYGREFRLVIAGEGRERQKLELMTARLGLQDFVSFQGYSKQLRELYSDASLLVIPSRTEGLPMVLLEAMVAEVPVVATGVGEIPLVLEHGSLGGVVPSNCAHALAMAIVSVLDSPVESMARAVAAREKVERHYSARAMARRYCDMYLECLSSP